MAIKISGSTIIDDSRVVVNADKIGIGTPSPNRDLEILSTNATGIGVSAASAQSTDDNKAITVFNAGVTTTFAVSYTGIVTANEYFGTFKGDIDPGVPITNANKIKIKHNSTNDFFNVPFFNSGLSDGDYGEVKYDSSNSLEYNPSLGNLRINSGAGYTGLILRTTNNAFDRAISFQNGAGNYVGYIGMYNIGGDDADMVFGVDFTNESVANNVTERLRINNTGNVGIGTTIASSRLHIGPLNGDGTRHLFFASGNNDWGFRFDVQDFGGGDVPLRIFSRSNNADTERITVKQDGGVGIGTINPTNYGGAVKLALHSSGHTGFTIAAGTSSDSNIFFADGVTGDATYRGNIKYAHNGDSMRFHTAADERMRIESGGDVGIGTPNALARLDVYKGTSATDVDIFAVRSKTGAFNIQCSDTNASNPEWRLRTYSNEDLVFSPGGSGSSAEKARIKTDGKFGIGTNDPGATLDVRGTALIADDIGNVQPSTFPASDVQLMVYTSTNGQPITNTNCARLLIATDAKQTGVQGYNGALDFGNSDATAANNSNQFNYRVASIMSNAAGDTSSSVADGDLQFWTKPASGSLAERLRIASDGEVGIGTINPGSLLHLMSADCRLRWSKSDAAANTMHWDLSAQGSILRLQAKNDADAGGGNLFDFHRTTNQINEFRGVQSGNTWFVVDNLNQEVGIGTDNPVAPLHILRDVANNVGVTTLLTLHSTRTDMTTSYVSGGSIRFLNEDGNNSGEAFIQANTPSSYNPTSEGNRERTVDFNFIQENAGTLNTNFTIKGQGNVGINQSDPREKLDVTAGRIILDQGYQLTWANGTTNRVRIHGDSGDNFIVENGSSNTEKLRVNSDGDLLRGGTGQDIGSASAPWDKVYANEFIGEINTVQENVTTGNLLVTGIATFQGNVSIAGTLTYEDVTNVDAIGLVTARSGIVVTGGNVAINTTTSQYGKLEINVENESNSNTEYYGQDFAIAIRANRGPNEGDEGNGIVFAQKYFSGDPALVRTGAILGYKSSGAGNFGGGLIFKTQEHGANPMSEKLRIASDGDLTHTGSDNVEYKMKCGTSTGNNIIAFLNSGGTTRGNITYDSDNNFLLFNVNQDERLRIASDGKVGIGTDDPSQMLTVRGTILKTRSDSGIGLIYLQQDGSQNGQILVNQNGGTTRVKLDSAAESYFNGGKLLISHTSVLHSGNLQVSAAGGDAIDINSYSTNANNGGRLSFYRSKNASIGSNTIVVDDDCLGRIDFRGYNTNGNSYDQGATIEARVDGSVNSSTDMPTAILFKTSNDGSASPDERLRITPDGKIGIGIANPDELLHIFSSASSSKIVLEADNNSADNGIFWVDESDNTQSEFYYSHPDNKQNLKVNGNGFEIYSKQQSNVIAKIGHGSGYNDVVVPNGKLGVGTDNASDILEVHKSSSTAYDATDDDAQRNDSASITIRNDNGTTNSFSQLVFDTAGSNQSIARIVAIRSGTSSNHLAFVTEHNNTKSEKLRITSDGVLKIERGSASDTALEINTTATTNACRIKFKESGTEKSQIAYSHNNDQLELIAHSGNTISFFTDGTEKVQLNTDGDLLRTGTSQDIGASGAPWDKIYANEFIGEINTTQTNVTTGNLLVTGISTFVGVATFHAVGIGTNSVDSAKLEINVGSAVTALDIQGSEGQLFSVTNNLTTGSIFAVNDVSGTPSINVDADGTIQLAPFLASDKIGIGTTNPAHKLDVIGDALVNGTLFLDDTANNIEKITGAAGYLDLYADSAIRLYESDANRLGITFDINQSATDRDVRIYFLGESTTYLHSPAANTLGFKINNNDTLRLADSKVGVNVTDPHCALDVRNASGTDPLVELHHSSYDVLGEVIRIGRTDDDAIRYHSIKAIHHATASSNQLQIFMHDGTGSPAIGQTEVVRIRGDGKVGIGTDSIGSSSPRLVVQDSIQLRSALHNTILFFQRTDTNANGWIGIPEWNDTALYIFGPTTSGNEVAAAYGGGDWTFSAGGNTAVKIRNATGTATTAVNIGGDYNQTTRTVKITGDAEVTGTLFANISGAITPTGDVDISGDLTVSGEIGIGTDNANRPLDVFGNAQIGTKSTADAELIIGRDGSGNRNAYIDLIGDNTYTDYGFRMIRKNGGPNAESQIAHRGTGNLSIAAQDAADIVFSTSGTDRLIIKADGKIGIGTVSSITLTGDDQEVIQVTSQITNSNADDVYGLRMDMTDVDDSVTVDDDRERGSIRAVFTGSSNQGDTNHELRIRNIHSDVNCNEDYDQVMGVYADVDTNHTSGTIGASYGLYADNRHTNSGTISNIYGILAYGRAEATATSAISNIYGIRGIARHAASNSGNTGNMIGVRGDAQIREGTVTRRTATNAYSFYADLHCDNVETPTPVVSGRKVMYFGDVSGATGISSLGRIYGLYIQDATDNRLAGNLQVVGVVTATSFSGTATEATNVTAIANNSTNTSYRVPFLTAATGTAQLQTDSADGMSYNPGTGELVVTTLNATNISGSISGAAAQVTLADDTSDADGYVTFSNGATGNQSIKTNDNLRYDAADGILEIRKGDGGIKFGPGTAVNDDAHIEWKGGSNAGYLRISTSDDSDAGSTNEYIEFGDYASQNRGGTFTQHVRIARDQFLVRTGSNTIATSDRFTIDSGGSAQFTGRVGIGTTGSSSILHLSSGDSGDCVLTLEADADGDSNSTGSDENNNPYIRFVQDGGIALSAIGMNPHNITGENDALVLSNSANANNGIIFKTGTSNGWANADERMRITRNGGIAFGGASNYGSSGQLLKSNGDAAPTWIDSSTVSGVTDVAVTQEGRSAPCYLPITVTGTSTKTIGIATESNAFGAKYIQVTEPSGSSICDGDIWYDTSTSGSGGVTISNATEATYRNIVFADSSSSTTLKVNDNSRLQVRPSDGALRVAGDITAFYSSDARLKKNVSPIKNALKKVRSISGNTFEWNEKTHNKGKEVGVIAQEIEKLELPGVTTTRQDGTKAVRYEKLVPLLIEAIKELKDEINQIKANLSVS